MLSLDCSSVELDLEDQPSTWSGCLILDVSSVSSVDHTAHYNLLTFERSCFARGIKLLLAGGSN